MKLWPVLAMALALTACDRQGDPAPGNQSRSNTEAGMIDGKVECFIAGAWGRSCELERADGLLTIRHPDGGFRRFRVLDDGRGLEAADGAEAAKLTILGDNQIEVAAGVDRYRLPAKIAEAR